MSVTHLRTLEDDGACLTNKIDDDVLSHIALSGSIMVVTTLSGQCRVTELMTRAECRFQLSSTNTQSMVVAKGTVVILHQPLEGSLQASLTTWTLHDHTAVHFSARLHQSVDQVVSSCDLKIMLDVSGTRVVMFEHLTEAGLMHFTRFSLDGEVQTESTLELPDLEDYAKHTEEATRTHTKEWTTVWTYSKTHKETIDSSTDRDTKEFLRVQYHPERKCMRLKKNYYYSQSMRNIEQMSNPFFWNDVAYSQMSFGRGFLFLKVMDFSASFLDGQSSGISWPEGCRFLDGGGMTRSIFFADQRFLINVFQYGFFVWAFDKGHGMTEIDTNYRKAREKATKDRRGFW